MKIFKRNIKIRLLGAIIVIAPVLAGLLSCSGVIYDDLDPCPEGVRLRFIYDYNMEFANAFYSQVSCLTVLVYDSEGKYMETRTVTDPSLLSDENWRMDVALPEGKYRLVAYGGMACDESSFHFLEVPSEGSRQESLKVALNDDIIQKSGATQLHHLFYGAIDVEVKASVMAYQDYVLPMIKDTNDIRIVLQHLSGEPVDPDDFYYSIIADNTHMDYDNSLISKGRTVYKPWETGSTAMGIRPDGTTVGNAYAQFSTGRLLEGSGENPRIRITRADARSDSESDNTVLDLDLIWLVSLARHQNNVKDMPLEEYLDRQSRWSFIFLLDENDSYYELHLKVNDWEVRINNIEN